MPKVSQKILARISVLVSLILLIALIFSISHLVDAATPNPGHPWTDIGDGTIAFTGTTAVRTFTLPDATSTILTTNSAVTVAQGGTGVGTLTGILEGNGTSAFTAVTAPTGNIVGDTDTQTLTNKTISKASNTLTGVAASGANSDITSLSALATALTVGQGGTGAASFTANDVLLGNGSGAFQIVAPGTSGNVLQSNGTTWTSDAADNQIMFYPIALYPGTLTAVTALTTGVSYFEYMGVAPKAYTSCTVLLNVTTLGATITWAEVALFKGTPTINTAASLTEMGFTSVASTFTTTGIKKTSVTATINAGDPMWVAFGSSATTPFQVRGMLADNIQTGTFQTATIRPSLAGSPQATAIASATAVPAWVTMACQ